MRYDDQVYTSRDGGQQTTSNCLVNTTEDNAGYVTYTCAIEQIYKEPVKITVPMLIKHGMLSKDSLFFPFL